MADSFDPNERVYGAATLQLPNEPTIAFDGFIPNLGENKGYNGIQYGISTSYDLIGGDAENQWAQYSYPAGASTGVDRVYPAAMWANADKVCQEAT